MKTHMNKILAGFSAGAMVLGLAACLTPVGDGDGLNTTGDIPVGVVTFADVQKIFNASCTDCHKVGGVGYLGTGGANNNGLDLTAGNSYATLVNVATYEAPTANPTLRVKPGSPDSSYLYRKIMPAPFKDGTASGTGVRMPMNANPLGEDDLNTIKRWIELGASDD